MGAGGVFGRAAAAVVGMFLIPTLGRQALYYAAALSVFLAIACQIVMPESVQFLAVGRAYRIAIVHTLAKLNPTRAAQYSRVRFSGRKGSTGVRFVVAVIAVSENDAGHLQPGVLRSVRSLWPHGLGSHGHAGARRRLCCQLRIWRGDPDDEFRRHAGM